MDNTFKSLILSKKFIAALAGVLVGLGARWGLSLDTETVAVLVAPLLVYIIAQGQADKGKAAAQIVANADKAEMTSKQE
jgi:hypothetical protein